MREPRRVELVEQLFHEALERDDANRASFLAEACAGDVALLAEVASLLASYERDPNLLQRPAFNLSASDVADSVLEEEEGGGMPEAPRVRGFRLVREVGRGGMGAVYEAFRADGEVGQRVAVKLVKRGMDTEFILRRFERERRILGALDHPYVARLLDGGATEDGIPFFVMEYVEGQPIDQYTREATLPTAERLGLFLKVCEAVSYAHRHRVIHRDLKPSNILVTDAGVPKLLDFGVAKLLDLDSLGRTGDATATAHRVMTPEYASPGQLCGLPPAETDDVYSLGVLLYILLTGHHPYRFRSRVPEEVLRSIVEGRVQRPSEAVHDSLPAAGRATGRAVNSWPSGDELRHDIRGNLDRVVLKALRREPERRYASVEEMAEDIRRYVAGRPVSARGDSLAYRAACFARKHPAYTVPTAAVAVLCILLGLILWLSGTHPKPRTSLAVMPFSNTGQGLYSEQLAEGITDGLTGDLSRLPQLFIPSHNSVYSYKGRQQSPQTIGRSLGVETLMVGEVAVDNESLRVRVELFDVGSSESIWGNTYQAKISEILALQRRITADVTRELGVAASAEDLSHSARYYTQDDEAYRLYLMGRSFFNKRTPADFRKGIEYFRKAVERDPSYALAYAGMADCYGLLGAYMKMETHNAFTSARDAANKALELDDGLAEAHTTLALVHWLYDWDWAAADREFRKAIALNPLYVTSHHWRGLFLGEMGRFDEAEAEMQKALERDPISAPVYADYGRVLYWARRYDEALEKYGKASEISTANFGAMTYEREQLYEQMGRLDDWAASVEEHGNFDAETREAYRRYGPRGYWTVWYRRGVNDPWRSSDGAEVCARIGDKDGALKELVHAIKTRDHRMTQLKVNPILDPLRSDPRFAELLRRMNLTR